MADTRESPAPKKTENRSVSVLSRLVDYDARWSLRFHTAFLPFPRSLLKALEFSGDGRLWFPVLTALYFSPLRRIPSLSWILLHLFAGCLLDIALVGLLKFIVRRPRPVYNKGMSLVVSVDHWSFPSGHSSRACFVGCFLFLCAEWIDGHSGSRVLLGDYVGIVAFWSISISVSRILLGRHFVFDVIAGAVLGVIEALIVAYVGKLLITSGNFAPFRFE